MKKYNIYYQKPDEDFDFMERNDISVANLDKTHILLRNLVTDGDLESIYTYMQGENWSPRGEARDLISSKGLAHTSMSVNDVIEDVREGKFYRVASFGFEELLFI